MSTAMPFCRKCHTTTYQMERVQYATRHRPTPSRTWPGRAERSPWTSPNRQPPSTMAAPGRMRRSRLGSSTPRKKNSSQSAGTAAITNSAAASCAGPCGAATFDATVASPSACRSAIQQAVTPLTKK